METPQSRAGLRFVGCRLNVTGLETPDTNWSSVMISSGSLASPRQALGRHRNFGCPRGYVGLKHKPQISHLYGIDPTRGLTIDGGSSGRTMLEAHLIFVTWPTDYASNRHDSVPTFPRNRDAV